MGAAGKKKIVSSAHLVARDAPELLEFEYGLMVSANAFRFSRVAVTSRITTSSIPSLL